MNGFQLPPQARMMQFISGKWISKPIFVVAKLGIPDLLADGPRHIDDLAKESGAHAPVLYRVMRALSGLGIFSELEGRCFEQTHMSECLRTGAMRPISLMFHAGWHDSAWDRLLHGVETGEIPFETAHGMPAMAWFEQHPRAADTFNQANAVKAMSSHRAIVDAYDFSEIKRLMDVGGGYGALMAEILTANPHMKGVVADLPEVVQGAETLIRERGLSARCQVTPTDFFESVPDGNDACLLSHVLHNWDDEKSLQILKNCHRALPPGAGLLLVEIVIPPGNEFSIGKLLDLEVFVMGGGRERTASEFQDLLAAAGFDFSKIMPTTESISVIEGIRV